MSCVFCEIVKREEPSYNIYEDDLVLAFLDHRPVRRGSTLVIPKKHYSHFIDLPDELAAQIVKVGNMIGQKMTKDLTPTPKRIGFVVHGFGVDHVHYIVVPMYQNDDVISGRYAKIIDGKIVYSQQHIPMPSEDDYKTVMQLLRIRG